MVAPDELLPELSQPTVHSAKPPEQPQDAVEKLSSGKRRKFARFVVAALSSIPWIGGVFSAAASFSAEKEPEGFNELEALWLKGHEEKIKELGETLTDIFTN